MLKKCIVIMVMFALVAGVAFAQQVSVSGGIEARFTLYEAEFGDHDGYASGDFPKPKASGSFGAAQIQLSGGNSDGTLTGLFRLRNVDIVRSDPWFHRVFINWKPVGILNVFMGIDQDGKFGTDALQGWAFHQGVDDYVHFQWWDFWRAVFPGNWDGFGAALSLYPVAGIDVNLVIPFGGTGWPQATNSQVGKSHAVGDLYTSGYRLQANFAVPDIGSVKFSYKGPYNNNHFQNYSGKYQDLTFLSDDKAFGALGISFLLDKLVPGLSANVGFATDNIVQDLPDGEALPIYFGAGVHFQSGDFGVKFRAGASLNTGYTEDHFYLTANVMPWYNLGVLGAYVDFGISLDKANADADMNNGFWVNPYVKVPVNGGYFQAGFSIRQHISGHGNVGVNMDDDYVRFDFPIVLGISF